MTSSSPSTQSVVSGRHPSPQEKSTCLAEGGVVMERNPGVIEHVRIVCTRLSFSAPMRESLGTRVYIYVTGRDVFQYIIYPITQIPLT